MDARIKNLIKILKVMEGDSVCDAVSNQGWCGVISCLQCPFYSGITTKPKAVAQLLEESLIDIE